MYTFQALYVATASPSHIRAAVCPYAFAPIILFSVMVRRRDLALAHRAFGIPMGSWGPVEGNEVGRHQRDHDRSQRTGSLLVLELTVSGPWPGRYTWLHERVCLRPQNSDVVSRGLNAPDDEGLCLLDKVEDGPVIMFPYPPC